MVQAANHFPIAIRFLAGAPSEQSFSALSGIWKDERASGSLKRTFATRLWQKQFNPEAYAKARANYEAWQYLAKTKRDVLVDKGFADWLMAQDPPVDGNAK